MAQSRSPPPFPTIEMRNKHYQEDEQEQPALGSLPEDALVEILSPSSFPPTEMRKKQHQEDELEPLGILPEGPLVEILSRVPYKPLCRFKCVSRPWLSLCSSPDIRKKSPQTLTGFFFYDNTKKNTTGFCNLSGRGPPMVDPSLPFLDKSYELVTPEHFCGGLLLCKCQKTYDPDEDEYNIVVCNPVTENWIELPPCPIDSPYAEEQYLGFDPAVPSRFVVFVVYLVESAKVAIYSSGRWATVQRGWSDEPFLIGPSKSVFLNDTMHMMTVNPSILTVDSEGKVWREINIPGDVPQSGGLPSIGQCQGRLYAWYIDSPKVCQLYVWALEDYDSAKWTLKHTVNVLELFGRHGREDDESYEMFAIHPDRNLIFLTDGKKKTISYDMDNRGVHVISTSEDLRDSQPYVPCFAEWLSDGH